MQDKKSVILSIEMSNIRIKLCNNKYELQGRLCFAQWLRLIKNITLFIILVVEKY